MPRSREVTVFGQTVTITENDDGTFSLPDHLESLRGFAGALKPAVEPIILARKPLIGTVAENVLAYGTGALNIDATRIATDDSLVAPAVKRDTNTVYGKGLGYGRQTEPGGRWPSNLALVHRVDCRPTTDDSWVCAQGCPAAALDEQSGERPGFSGGGTNGAGFQTEYVGGGDRGWVKADPTYYGDSGGASRFFARFAQGIDEQIERDGAVRYVAKAPGKERPSYVDADGNRVVHSTVKPLTLCRYLVKLICPPGGTVLDPFTGSGSTAEAAVLEGMRFVGCELTAEYLPLIDQRIARGYRGGPDYPDPVDPPARPDETQPTLF